MSYLDTIAPEERAKLTEIKQSAFDVFKDAKVWFHNTYPRADVTKAELRIEDKIFLDYCDFYGIYDCSVIFKNCFFLKAMIIADVTGSNRITFDHCFFDYEVRITKNVEIASFDIIMACINSQLVVEAGKFEEARWTIVDNCRVLINGGFFTQFSIGYWGGGCQLRELSFHLPKLQGLIRVTGHKSRIERLELFQYAVDVSLSFEDISVNSISIYRYRNEKSLRISNISVFETNEPSQFSVIESYLGKAEFYSINFHEFKTLYLLDTHLVDCILVNTRFGDNIYAFKGRSVSKSEEEIALIDKIMLLERKRSILKKWFRKPSYDRSIIVYYEKKREILRQLKYALSKQGDTVNEQRFHSLEMKAHDRSLTWCKHFWTKLIIKASSWTSDFGQSLWRPVLFLLAGHFAFFWLLVLANAFPGFHFSFQQPTSGGFWAGFHEYFVLINPLRNSGQTFPGGLILVDIFIRIWASYMIYNIIRASRRFIK